MEEHNSGINISELFSYLKKHIKLIVIITISITLITGIINFYVVEPIYKSSTSIVIGKDVSNRLDKYNNNDVVMYQKLMKTYAEIARSNDVAMNAIENINKKSDASLNEEEIEKKATKLQNLTTVSPQNDTQILIISVSDTDPKEAKIMIDALTDSFMGAAKKIYPDGNIQILDTAKIPKNPIKPNKKLNIAIAFVIGLLSSIGIAFFMEYLDNTIKSEEDISSIYEIPVIGNIHNFTI